jgi:hypothetical protein
LHLPVLRPSNILLLAEAEAAVRHTLWAGIPQVVAVEQVVLKLALGYLLLPVLLIL